MAEIKGIKMNGEVLTTFNTTGGGGCYRHILKGTDTIIVYNNVSSAYAKNTAYHMVLERDVPYIWYSRNYTYAGIARRGADDVIYCYPLSGSPGDSNEIGKSSYFFSDTVTQVPFPWM